ncbi:hypothetical protein OIK40_13680 [Erythrobacter sp. sf7]|uniref:Alpha/beta hydrolase n=1 Tax=Erythrobacter fulvus TaxID=2987523 RepID=A0ABT5JUG7_9SPHN|nr:hypothetical protein [Erythrobacter fulvus]MDC8755696.1 hypothetical protein [Erythrobacter fulvus]
MNRAFALLLAAFALLLPAVPAVAQSGARVVASVSWVEEWDPATGQWVRVEDSADTMPPPAYQAATTTTVTRSGAVTITETVVQEPVRFIARTPRAVPALAGTAQYGPFRVLDPKRAALVDSTDAASPAAFAAMLAANPGLEVIEFLDAPGTSNDLANLALGRAIRAAGLATHVPRGGSARSGAVELFLAGTRRSMDPGALFAVHSWRDEAGREPADFAPDAPENRLYLDYYAEMGMNAGEAREFYAMTNSVPHAGALWLSGSEMAQWVAAQAEPRGRSVPDLPMTLLLAAVPAVEAIGESARSSIALALANIRRAAQPRLAYADPGAMPLALLDSGRAFP